MLKRATEYSWLFVTFSAAGFWDKLTKHANSTWHTGAADKQNTNMILKNTEMIRFWGGKYITQKF